MRSLLLAARGEHEDRHIGALRAAAEAAAHLDPADPLDHPVEQDDVGLDLVDQDQRFLAIAGAGDGIAGALEMKGDEVGERPVVLDQQEARCRPSPSAGDLRVALVGHVLAGRGK